MPYTTFSAGAVLTASQLNTNVRDQVVTPFASTSARDSAITSPVEGMVCVITGEDRLYVYDGAAWQRCGHYSATGRTGCEISRNANQSFTNGVAATISFDTEGFDSDGFFAPTSPTVTIPTGLGGIYAITVIPVAAAVWGANSADQLFIGGTNSITLQAGVPQSGIGWSAHLIYPYAASNTINVNIKQNTGGALNFTCTLKVFRLQI